MPAPIRESRLALSLADTLGHLIALPSAYPPGDTRAICAYAGDRLARLGYRVEHAARIPEADNVVARLGSGRPQLVFNAHADTVAPGDLRAWTTDPYQAVVRDGRVHGLGAGNCKGSMAVHLWLAEEIARRGGPQRGEVVFTFVGDEERLGPDGLRYLRDSGRVTPDMLVLGAQTEGDLIIAERGVLWVRITAHGRAAHAGDPTAGDNAILRLMRLILGLETHFGRELAGRIDGDMRSTINLGRIRGGENTNVVPGSCWAEIDRRLLPGESVDRAYGEIETTLAAAGEPPESYRLERLAGTNGFRGPADGTCVVAFQAAIATRLGRPARFRNALGVSDGRYFAGDGIEIVNFGPGSGSEGHAANESVPLAELVDATLIQLEVVERLLGLGR